MVHGDDGVVITPQRVMKNRVRWPRPGRIDAVLNGTVDGRANNRKFLRPQGAALARMWVKAADANPTAREIEAAAGLVSKADRLPDRFHG